MWRGWKNRMTTQNRQKSNAKNKIRQLNAIYSSWNDYFVATYVCCIECGFCSYWAEKVLCIKVSVYNYDLIKLVRHNVNGVYTRTSVHRRQAKEIKTLLLSILNTQTIFTSTFIWMWWFTDRSKKRDIRWSLWIVGNYIWARTILAFEILYVIYDKHHFSMLR